MRQILLPLLLAIVFFPGSSFGQDAVIKGKITDLKTKESLIGVNVVLSDNSGVASDIDGNFELKLAEGEHNITFRFIGYKSQNKVVSVKAGETVTMNILLEQAVTQLDMVVVSAGKFEQKIEDITVSMEVLKPAMVENKGTTSMEKAVSQAPGVQIVDNEVQIRGGSGYSFGAGSRVMILVDDLPMISGDAGRPAWNYLPIENLEQIEIIKGASSVLYGSSALSGVINIRTAYPKDAPQTKINIYSGAYDNPERDYAAWWDKNTNPLFTGMNFFHSRKIKNLDLVIGGNAFFDDGYIGPESQPGETVYIGKYAVGANHNKDTIFINNVPYSVKISGDSLIAYNVNPKPIPTLSKYENRIRFNSNLRYRSKKIDGLSFGVNMNAMYSRYGNTLILLNCDTGLYRSFPGAITLTIFSSFNIDPFVTYYDDKGNRHSFKSRYNYLDNNNNNDQANQSAFGYGEYQYQKQFANIKNFTITSGVMGMYTKSVAPLYSANEDSSGISHATNIAGYFQVDKKFWERVTFNAGMRGEYFKINNTTTETDIKIGNTTLVNKLPFKPVFRSGVTVKVLRETYVRTSFGQGYRFPTIAEKYIRTGVGTMNIFPNVNLQPENSWNAEIGIKQGFKIGGFLGYLDFAVFRQEFEDNIEFNFGFWDNSFYKEYLASPSFGNPDSLSGSLTKGIGFRSINVGKTRVGGCDVSLLGQGKIGPVTINTLCGYTYTKPVALEPTTPYLTMSDSIVATLLVPMGLVPDTSLTFANSSSDPSNNILKYRFQHLLKLDLEATIKGFSAGASLRYNSFMQNLDKVFLVLDTSMATGTPVLPTGYVKYRLDRYGKEDYVIDTRLSYKMNATSKVAFIINNLLNREYMIRPLLIESPRTFTVQYTMDF